MELRKNIYFFKKINKKQLTNNFVYGILSERWRVAEAKD